MLNILSVVALIAAVCALSASVSAGEKQNGDGGGHGEGSRYDTLK